MTTTLANNLRKRSIELGLTNNEVARRAGLHERRYANYAIGRREPNVATLVRLAEVLHSSPNELLGFGPTVTRTKRNLQMDRLNAASEGLSPADLDVLVRIAEGLANGGGD